MQKKIDNSSPIAVIDIGSNSVRLIITNGIFNIKKLITTRLGGGLDKNGYLSIESILTTANAVKTLLGEALSVGVKNVYAFSTAAVRNAKNKDEFLSAVKTIAGIEVDVVLGEVEAELAVIGALQKESGAVIDIGGASTEVAFSKNGNIYYKKSFNVGAVTLNKLFLRNKLEIKNYLNNVIQSDVNYSENLVKAIGGTSTSIGAIDLKLKVYDDKIVDGHVVEKEKLQKMEDFLYALEPKDISNTFAVDSKRSEIIAGGVSIMLRVFEAFNFSKITISESDNLEGYIRYKKLL